MFALIGLTGNFDVAGGNKAAPFSWLEIGGAGFITRQHEFEVPRSWDELPPRVGAGRFPVWTEIIDQAQAMDLPRQIRTGDPYPLRALVAFGLNHRMFPGSDRFLEAIQKLDFICDVDLFATDSSRYADIVLPACSSVERSEVRCYPEKYVTLTEPAIEPLGEARSDTDIVFALAQQLGLDDPLLNPEPDGAADPAATFTAALDWMFEPSGMTMAELGEHPGGMPVPDPLTTPDRQYLERGFPTPSGKMEFVSSVLERLGPGIGVDALPDLAAPGTSPRPVPTWARDYPVHPERRLPPADVRPLAHVPAVLDAQPAPAAGGRHQPGRRAALGIAQDDWIELSTPAGSIRVLANLTELAQPGVVHMYHGYPEADVNLLLTPTTSTPSPGFPAYRSAAAGSTRRRSPRQGPVSEEVTS